MCHSLRINNLLLLVSTDAASENGIVDPYEAKHWEVTRIPIKYIWKHGRILFYSWNSKCSQTLCQIIVFTHWLNRISANDVPYSYVIVNTELHIQYVWFYTDAIID